MKSLLILLFTISVVACSKNEYQQKSLSKLIAEINVPENGMLISNVTQLNISVKNAIVSYDVCDRETAG